jgi:hypothetical protein
MKLLLCTIIAISIFSGCSNNNDSKEIKMLKGKIAQFAPIEIKYDSTELNERQRIVIHKLFEASQIIDSIYLNQVYSKNREIKYRLQNSSSEEDQLKLKYFDIMFGPFDRLDHNKPFMGTEQKPKGANFYPEDMTKEEFNNWIKEHPQDDSAFTSTFTVIRRENGKLTAIPYSEFYMQIIHHLKII